MLFRPWPDRECGDEVCRLERTRKWEQDRRERGDLVEKEREKEGKRK